MRIRLSVAICVLLLAGGLSASPTCVLKGHVRDARTGEPLVGASVVVRGTECGNATDLKGDYVIVGLPAMTGTATAAYVGYDDTSASFTTTTACTTRLDLRLAPLVLSVSRSRLDSLLALKNHPASSAPSNSAKGGVKRAADRPKRSRLPLPALRNANKHSDRFPIQAYGNGCLSIKWGYMDKTGKVVIKPQFDTAENFSSGLALVKVGSSHRYIDTAGHFAFGGEFKEATGFSEGAASVVIRDSGGHDGWGVIDRTGKVIFRSQSHEPVVFSEGLAWFGDPNLGRGAIGRSGDTVIKPMLAVIPKRFSEGLALVWSSHHNGYLNKAGKIVIKPQFDWAADFHEGLAYFMNEGNPPDRWGYISKTGKVVIRPEFENAGDFSEGLAPVRIDGKWGYINRAGRVVIAPQFAEARSFSEGLAVVSGIDGSPLFGYIDRGGKTVIKPQFGRAGDFSDGLAQVRIGDKPSRRRGRGDYLLEQPSDNAGYVDSYRSGYIDKAGRYVW